jgi:hypothetical protein
MMIWVHVIKQKNQIIMDYSNALVHILTSVKVPYHAVKATLLNPSRQEVRLQIWNLGGKFWYDIINEGRTCRCRWKVPQLLLNASKCFSQKRVGVTWQLWQASMIEKLRKYREDNDLPSNCQFYVEQDIELPVEVKTSRHQSNIENFTLPCGLEVVEIQLMGATVYGSTAVTKERTTYEEIMSSSDEGEEDNEDEGDDMMEEF